MTNARALSADLERQRNETLATLPAVQRETTQVDSQARGSRRLTRIENADALHAWLASAPNGAIAEFHRGVIQFDRVRRPVVNALALAVSAARDQGLVAVFTIVISPGQRRYRLRRVRA